MAKRLSKRVSLSRRYNLAKKVRDHHKKVRKQARLSKKNGVLTSKQNARDPGIPNNWPFKQQELMDIETTRLNSAELKQRKKLGLPAPLPVKSPKIKETLITDVSVLMAQARASSELYERALQCADALPSSSNAADIEQTRRRFYRELRTVVHQADVVIQVLDARDPQACRNPSLETEILASGKRLVLLLNKVDLVPREAVQAWLDHLRRELPCLPFQADGRLDGAAADAAFSVGSGRGAGPLMKLLKKYSLSGNSSGGTSALSVGVVGYPNCGKSSVINALLSGANKKTRTKTGNAAGVTTQHQQIVLDKKLTLIDSPGVVFATEGGEVETQASLVIRKAVNVASIEDPVAVTEAVVRRISKQQVALQFRLAEFETVDEFLNNLGKAKCKFKRGGVVDKDAAARFALHAWADGKAKFFTMPEVKTRHNQAVLVAEAKPDFNLDELFKEADAAFQNTTEHGNFMHVGM